jgi:hypothetical protein
VSRTSVALSLFDGLRFSPYKYLQLCFSQKNFVDPVRSEISCGGIVGRPVVRWVRHHRATLLLWHSVESLRLPRAFAAWAWASRNVLVDTLPDK